jgi:hypothetical protein
MSNNSNNKKEAMLEALEKSLGVVTTAAEMVGINRKSHYDWYNNDPEYKAAVDELKDVALDFAVTALYKLIEKGDTAATIFYCKTQGKKRGYIERQEITGEEGQPIIQIAKNL